MTGSSGAIIVAGGGIGGLTAALAFARRGRRVHVLERADEFSEVGAGLQITPNAVKVLDALGVAAGLAASRPNAVVLMDARTLDEIASIPLGPAAEKRWGAPYLVAHRADLQQALLDAIRKTPEIILETGSTVTDAVFHDRGASVTFERGGALARLDTPLLVGADGVWSRLRELAGRDAGASRFSGFVAWRCLVSTQNLGSGSLPALVRSSMGVFTHPDIHVVAYPIRGGSAVNMVAITRGSDLAQDWATSLDNSPLETRLSLLAPPLAGLIAGRADWTAWPIYETTRSHWTNGKGLALLGDASHAMVPFMAQGAAMAIEDAWVLAHAVGSSPVMADTLETYARLRAPRIRKAISRARLNRFAWHAWGPVAMARNLVLAMKGPEGLAADLDWLYGWEPER